MRDVHCHILPGVDDGACNLVESLEMVRAAQKAGVTSIVCTPHCRRPYFDFEAMWQAFHVLSDAVAGEIPLQMGFEVSHSMLMRLGMEEWHDRLCFEGSGEFLLELEVGADKVGFAEYERTIYQLQCWGHDVIIAHPERYRLLQKDFEYVERLVRMGCTLQASSDFLECGLLRPERRLAKKIFGEGMYGYIASDAHCVEHYGYLQKACAKYPLGE